MSNKPDHIPCDDSEWAKAFENWKKDAHDCHALHLETGGNQAYVFGSRRRVEHIGASELTYRSCIHWVLEEAGLAGPSVLADSVKLAKASKSAYSSKYLPLCISSGKAQILCQTKELAEALLHSVTKRALKDAPGLDLSGSILPVDWNTSLVQNMMALGDLQARSKNQGSAGVGRMLRLPLTAECPSSGQRAGVWGKFGKEPIEAISRASWEKRRAADYAHKRLKKAMESNAVSTEGVSSYLEFGGLDEEPAKRMRALLLQSLDYYFENKDADEEQRWIGVVHADGNGFGMMFQIVFGKEGTYNKTEKNAEYVKEYRAFSRELDEAVQRAVAEAIIATDNLKRKGASIGKEAFTGLQILPLIIGGDDVTVLVEGGWALEWTAQFLNAFAKSSEDFPTLKTVLKTTNTTLTGCAGVALVKHHFPFFTAYDLAEALAGRAKAMHRHEAAQQDGETMKPLEGTWIDFHVVYDSSSPELKEARAGMEVGDKGMLTCRPLHLDERKGSQRSWSRFEERVKAIAEQRDGKHVLPLSQVQTIREAVHQSVESASEVYKLAKAGMNEDAKSSLEKVMEKESPWANDPWSEKQITGVIDALDGLEFHSDAVQAKGGPQ